MGKSKLPIAKRIALDLAACKKAFDQVRIPWVITDGIVLGYARYKKIMPWDTDLDMGIFVEINNKQWIKIMKSLINNGFRIKRIGKKKDFLYCRRQSKFNMWLFHKKGNFYEAFPPSTAGFKFVEKAIWYDKPQMVNFLGDKYPMPNHISDYLTHRYGPNWETNIRKSHNDFFREKRGDPKNVKEWRSHRIRKVDGKLWWPAYLKVGENIENLKKVW